LDLVSWPASPWLHTRGDKEGWSWVNLISVSRYNPALDHLLLFDGVCPLCEASVQFILRHDPAGRIKFAAIQSPLGRSLCASHGLDPDAPAAVLFLTPNGAFMAGDAVFEVARALSGWWKIALVFKSVPRSLRDFLYHFIARRRYRWFGRYDACMLPTPELLERTVTE